MSVRIYQTKKYLISTNENRLGLAFIALTTVSPDSDHSVNAYILSVKEVSIKLYNAQHNVI